MGTPARPRFSAILTVLTLVLGATALAACDQDSYASSPADRNTHMGDVKAMGGPVPAPTASAGH
jgi:hypothetical protein